MLFKLINKCKKEILRCAPTFFTYVRFLLFCVHQFAYVSVSLCVCGSVCNPFQVFKNSFAWAPQWLLSKKMIKTQCLTSSDWGCPLDNDPKLVLSSEIADNKELLNSSACISDLLFSARTQKMSHCCIKAFRNSSKY